MDCKFFIFNILSFVSSKGKPGPKGYPGRDGSDGPRVSENILIDLVS